MIDKIKEFKEKLTPFHLISFILFSLLAGGYFFRFMTIRVDQSTYTVVESILTLIQVCMILVIAIIMYLLIRLEGKLMKISALTIISLIPLIGVVHVLHFLDLDNEFYLKIHENSDILMLIFSIGLMAFLSFFWNLDVLKFRKRVFSIFAFLWSLIVVLFLFVPTITEAVKVTISIIVFILGLVLIIFFYFFKERFRIAFPQISFGLFLIFVFGFQFGFFTRIFQPDSLGILVSQVWAVLGYIFGLWALVESLAVSPKEELKEVLIEREKIISSLQTIVRHDAANYLATAISFIEVALDSKSLDYIEKAIKPIERAMLLLDYTTNITKQFLEREKELVKLSPIIKTICDEVEQDKESFDKKKVECKITVEDILLAYHPLIEGAIKNILENALKFTPAEEVRIDISSLTINENGFKEFNLIFEDYGQGINPDLKTKLLIKPVESEKGHGFGLFMYNYLLEKLLGGRISIEDRVKDDYTKGARVILSIPLLN